MPKKVRMDKIRREKVAYAKKAYKDGTTTVAELQKVVKTKFGSGISFRDIGAVFPASSRKKSAQRKARAASATKRGPGRPRGSRNKTTARRGRPPASEAEQYLLFVGDDAEAFATPNQVERRIGELIDDGHSPSDLSIYKKENMRISVTHRI